ncbi:MAG: hypothetical protein OSB58_17485, partial [Alphaproteobacteria bacterium]|nr:hypothetical protein [Alphaproteobacteria bacterium]
SLYPLFIPLNAISEIGAALFETKTQTVVFIPIWLLLKATSQPSQKCKARNTEQNSHHGKTPTKLNEILKR